MRQLRGEACYKKHGRIFSSYKSPNAGPLYVHKHSVSTYNGYFLAISRPGDPDPCVYHMLMGPTTYKGPLTRRGCLSFFSLFYLIIVLLSTRRTTSLVLESIDRFGFCRFPLSHPLVLVLSNIPTSTIEPFLRSSKNIFIYLNIIFMHLGVQW